MQSPSRPTLGANYIAFLGVTFLLLLLAAGIVRNVSVRAQLAGASDVIYRRCWDSTTFEEGRFERCGVDEAATREHQRRLAELQEEAEKATRPLTPQEEKRVIEHIKSRFQTGADATLRMQLLSLLASARVRLTQLLTSDTYAFDPRERQTIEETAGWIDQRIAQYKLATLSKSDVRSVRQELGAELSAIAAIVTAKQREGGAEVSRVENLVVRIDDLVARVGTVIRDLERSGERVPGEVRSGHRRASDLVREAKATCSTSRPAGCTQLHTILETIEEMRTPLCAIESPILNFCS